MSEKFSSGTINHKQTNKQTNINSLINLNRGGGAVGKSVRLASGRLRVRIPAATDLSRKNR